jgi:hypothetical protein
MFDGLDDWPHFDPAPERRREPSSRAPWIGAAVFLVLAVAVVATLF